MVGLYALVFGTGDHQPSPKLGIDLKGGTTVTLTARTLNGQPPSQQSLDQAQSIIQTRVDGLGVAGAQVVLQGNNIIITVPGNQGDEAKNLGQTAKLLMRPVVQSAASTPAPATSSSGAPTATTTPKGTGSLAPATSTGSTKTNGLGAPNTYLGPSGSTASNNANAQGLTSPQAYHEAAASTTPTPTPTPTPSGGANPNESVAQQQAAAIDAARKLRQNKDSSALATEFNSYVCPKAGAQDPLLGNDDPAQALITCDETGGVKYLLGPSIIDGQQISDASSSQDPNGVGYVVNVTFKSAGSKTWATYTAAHNVSANTTGDQVAFVLDTKVESAPTIQSAINGGNTQISGNFTQPQAQNLAQILKYGSLPLAFDSSNAQTISATLGLTSLKWGLTAGAIGLLLVFVYCLFYYRALGVLTILSLILSGVTVFGVLVLLGRWISYSLDLAGVAGFIIAIGITADSFVVFFERLKDEVREGRTFRSAVPRAWIRARRTILASDAVNFLAAVVLYVFAVSDVQGFAFTLGLSTVLDLLIVFLVTHPLVVLASRSKTLSKPGVSGLGAVQRAGVEQRAARATTRPSVKGA
ncbi:MAG TPA: protein translocase subunit SecD [Pseudonocardiaceae bacterium]|nr:protein translocase subunit SecD [Pseudonocardiaceae bacterium]